MLHTSTEMTRLQTIISKLINQTINNSLKIKVSCDFKDVHNRNWQGIVCSINHQHPEYKIQVSVYPTNSHLHNHQTKHLTWTTYHNRDLKKIIKQINPKLPTLYQDSKQTAQNIIGSLKDIYLVNYSLKNTAQQIKYYFKLATEMIKVAKVLSHNSAYLNSAWQRKALKYGQYFSGKTYQSMVETLSESASESTISPTSNSSYNEYLNSLNGYKSQALEFKYSEASLKSSYNSSFTNNFYTIANKEESYRNHFNSLLATNPSASSYTSQMNKWSNQAETEEDVYWNTPSKVKRASASVQQDSLDDLQDSLRSSMLKSMETSEANVNHD